MTVIFIECGTSMTSPFNTGIQKVVRSVIRESETVCPAMGLQCFPVAFENGNFFERGIEQPSSIDLVTVLKRNFTVFINKMVRFAFMVDNATRRMPFASIMHYQKIRKIVGSPIKSLYHSFMNQGGRTWEDILEDAESAQVHSSGDASSPILLLLDSTWNGKMWVEVEKFRASGGHVCALLYDLIPFSHPDTVEEYTRKAHTSWWREAPLHVDSIICISKTVREQFIAWQKKMGLSCQIPPEMVDYFYLGSELKSGGKEECQLPSSIPGDMPFCLVVGSIEPRKNHGVILDAFEILWKKGLALSLVIVGGHGWKCEAFLDRVHTHPMLNKQLFLLRGVTEAELGSLYNKAEALIIASLEEGFGLPIVEAFQRGVPVVCSDIPVFHEIGEHNVRYFNNQDAASLAQAIQETITAKVEGSHRQKTNWLTWKESTQQLLGKLLQQQRQAAQGTP